MGRNPIAISFLIIFAALAAVIALDQRGVPQVVTTNLEKIPNVIAGYQGTEDRFSQAVYDELNADTHVYRHYRKSQGDQIDLYIGYYGTAKGGRTGHNPYACFPSSGWGIIETDTVKLADQNYQKDIHVNYMLTKKEDTYIAIFHWYQSVGTKVLETGMQQNIQRFLGKVLYNRNDGAFVRVSTVTRSGDIDEAKRTISAFSEEILKLLPTYWPVERPDGAL